MADKTFRQLAREAGREARLGVADRVRLRIVLRKCPERLEQELFDHAQAEGIIPVSATVDSDVSAFDWAAFFEFAKFILPIILKALL